MRSLLSFLILGAFACLTFPGHLETLHAQGVASAQPPVSSNPEIAALQARSAIFEKQLAVINAKLDKLLTVPTSAPSAEPVQAPKADPVPIPPPAPKVLKNADGTVSIDGVLYAPLIVGPPTVSLTGDACSSSQTGAACGSTSSGGQRTGLFGGFRARRANRVAAGGCGG